MGDQKKNRTRNEYELFFLKNKKQKEKEWEPLKICRKSIENKVGGKKKN